MGANSILTSLNRRLGRSASEPSDGELLAQYVRDRDESAFGELVRRHGGLVLGVARRQLGNAPAADDVFQAVFLALARSAPRLTRDGSLTNWLYTVALRQARKARARAARRRAHETATVPGQAVRDPLEEISGRELMRRIDEEVARLPEKYRLPIVLCVMQGKSRDEAARQLGWTEGAVRGRLERGRARLARRLSQFGLDPAAMVLVPLAGGILTRELTARTVALPTASVVPAEIASLLMHGGQTKWAMAIATSVVAVALGGFALSASDPAKPIAPAAAVGGAKTEAAVDPWAEPLPERSVQQFGTARFRHGTEIKSMAVSADGKLAVVSSDGHWLGGTSAYDLTTGKPHFSISQSFHDVYGHAIAPDGKTIATFNLDKIQIWNAATGQLATSFPRARNSGGTITNWLTYSPDGKYLFLTAFDGKTIEMVEAATGVVRGTFPHANTVFAAAVSPDGRWLAAGGYDQDAKGKYFSRLWDIAAGKEVAQYVHKYGLRSLAFSPDGTRLAGGGDGGEAYVWDRATGREIQLFRVNGAGIRSVAYAPDGKTLAVGTNQVRLFDLDSGKERRTLARKAGNLRFSADSKTLTGSVGGAIHQWDVSTGESRTPVAAADSAIDQILVTPNGRTVVTLDQSGSAWVWESASGKLVRRVPMTRQRGLAMSRDGRYLAWPIEDETVTYKDPKHASWTHTGNRIRLYDIAADRAIDRFPGFAGDAHDSTFLPDGRSLLTVDHMTGSVRIWDVAQGKERRHFDISKADDRDWPRFSVRKSVVSADGKLLAVAHDRTDNTTALFGAVNLGIWDIEKGQQVHEVTGHINEIRAMALSPDSRWLVSSGAGPSTGLTITDLRTRSRAVGVPDKLAPDAVAAAFSPDGRTLAAASADGIIRVFEVATWTLRCQYIGHRDRVTVLAHAPDGRLLSGGLDTVAIAWDPRPISHERGTLESAITGLSAPDAAAAYAAQGRLLARPAEAVALLAKRIEPAAAVKPEQIAQWIADLDDAKFATRERGSRALRRAGRQAETALTDAANRSASAEVRKRAGDLVSLLNSTTLPVDELEAIRAVEVLDWLATPAAKDLLQSWSKGEPTARLTRAAQEAVGRRPERD